MVTSGPSSRSRRRQASGVRTVTELPEARATNSSTVVSAMSRPRPTTISRVAVWAISLIRCEDTNTVRPSAASALSRLRLDRRPVVLPVDPRAACARLIQAGDQPHRGGLARPVRPEETGHHPRLHHEVQAVNRELVPVPLAEVSHLDHRRSFIDTVPLLPADLTLPTLGRPPRPPRRPIGHTL